MTFNKLSSMKFFSLMTALLLVTLAGCNKKEETPVTPITQPAETSAPMLKASSAASAAMIEAASASVTVPEAGSATAVLAEPAKK